MHNLIPDSGLCVLRRRQNDFGSSDKTLSLSIFNVSKKKLWMHFSGSSEKEGDMILSEKVVLSFRHSFRGDV